MKESYRELCKIEKSIPIFSQDWWLDATAGAENWDVVCLENDGKIIASLPFTVRKKLSFIFLSQPKLTQALGPWIHDSDCKYTTKLSNEKKTLTDLFSLLPQFDSYAQNWSISYLNWIPLYWKKFQQNTRYTYVIDDLSNKDILWAEMQENIRREIKKAKDRFHLKILTDVSLDDFILLNGLTFDRQNKTLPYNRSLINNIDKACNERSCRKIFMAQDQDGKNHAAAYIVWDENSAYYLMGGADPSLRNSGAMSLCLWESIKFASTVTKTFNFEGSMIEPIEKFFRGFGARQRMYFHISKTNSKLLKLKQFIFEL